MKQIEAIIEIASDGTFSVYCKDEIFSGSGGTITEAKEDMLAQMSFYKRTAIEEGFKYPEWMDEEYSIQYTTDAISLLKYFVSSGLFSLAGLENSLESIRSSSGPMSMGRNLARPSQSG